MRKLLSFLVILATSAPAFAQQIGDMSWYDQGKIIDAVACNGSSTVRRFTLTSGSGAGYGLLDLQVEFTRVAATAVALSCTTSINGQATWATLQSCSVATGVCTSTDASWSKDVSGGSANWVWRLDFLGASDVRCTFSCTAGGGSDLFTVYGRLSEQ